jgi:hypothetical protein
MTPRDRPPLARPLTAVAGVLVAVAMTAGPGSGWSVDPSAAVGPPMLWGDVTDVERELLAVVVGAAEHHDVHVVVGELELRFVDRVGEGGLLGGLTDGEVVLIGRNLAEPELFLLHEFAHAVVGIDHGHEEPWRSVYLTAVREVYGDRRAERELRRIRWIYDKSYLDGRGVDGAVPDAMSRPVTARGASGSGRRGGRGSRGPS